MKEPEKSKFSFVDFYVNESHFELAESYADISININPSGRLFKSDNKFELLLDVTIVKKGGGKLINLKCTSVFSFDQNSQDGEIIVSDYFLINAPAIAFPYIRSYISTLTIQSGKQAIVLPTLNLAPLKDHIKKIITIID